MDTNQNLERISQGKTERNYSGLLKISAAFNVALSMETQAVYLTEFAHLSDGEFNAAVTATIREWQHASMMPPPSFILERAIPAEVPVGRKFASAAEIDPARCPSGWTPEQVFEAHLTQERIRGTAYRPMPADSRFPSLDELGRRTGATKEEIAGWLEIGKERGRRHMAELARDPQWRAQQARCGVPEHRAYAEGVQAQQNGPTAIPVNPAERQSWARGKAVEMGWVEREAGDEI